LLPTALHDVLLFVVTTLTLLQLPIVPGSFVAGLKRSTAGLSGQAPIDDVEMIAKVKTSGERGIAQNP
jgi:hypothetical protein